jgi:hypothetical protein
MSQTPAPNPAPRIFALVSSQHYAAAEALLRPLHEARLVQFPNDAHETLLLLGILAHAQGRFREAEEMMSEVVQVRSSRFGREDARTMRSRVFLREVRVALGKE